jgi:MoxR-like ATPase
MALVEGRDYVIPDDIKRLARPVLSHRILAKSFRQGGRNDSADALVEQVLQQTTVPT